MSVFGFLRPKWKHPDPVVRVAAVGGLTDEKVLTALVQTDESADVRRAALQKLNDQDVLAEVAQGESLLNLEALVRLNDTRLLVRVAQRATSPAVRQNAVGRIGDKIVLQQIAAFDPHEAVRREAELKNLDTDLRHQLLKITLAKLQVAEKKLHTAAEFCGNLEDVCGALVGDRRFRINAVVTPTDSTETPVGAVPTGASDASTPVDLDRAWVELLATNRVAHTPKAGELAEETVFKIKVWREGENAYNGSVETRQLTRDPGGWTTTRVPGNAESPRV